MSSQPDTPRPASKGRHFKVRVWHVLFLIVLVAATLGLAWWQWTRFRSGSGTFQNLGYAFQWPFFGAFFVFAYKKILEYENDKYDQEHGISADGEPAEPTTYVAPVKKSGPEEIGADFMPERPTMSVEEFNQQFQPRRHRGENN